MPNESNVISSNLFLPSCTDIYIKNKNKNKKLIFYKSYTIFFLNTIKFMQNCLTIDEQTNHLKLKVKSENHVDQIYHY
jgi:hypothetical protein